MLLSSQWFLCFGLARSSSSSSSDKIMVDAADEMVDALDEMVDAPDEMVDAADEMVDAPDEMVDAPNEMVDAEDRPVHSLFSLLSGLPILLETDAVVLASDAVVLASEVGAKGARRFVDLYDIYDVGLLDPAIAPSSSNNRGPIETAAVAAALGLLIGAVIALVVNAPRVRRNREMRRRISQYGDAGATVTPISQDGERYLRVTAG